MSIAQGTSTAAPTTPSAINSIRRGANTGREDTGTLGFMYWPEYRGQAAAKAQQRGWRRRSASRCPSASAAPCTLMRRLCP